MSVNQILPVNTQISASGLGTKANGIVQIQQPQQSGAFILADNNVLYMQGLIIPQGGGLNQIISQDTQCSVTCNNGGTVDIAGNVGDFVMLDNAIISSQLTNATNMQWFDQNLVVNTPLLTINNNPSSQQFIVYGQSKGEAVTTQFNSVLYPNPEIGQADITMNLYAYNNFMEWFMNDQYNMPNNAFIEDAGQGFRLLVPNQMVQIQLVFQMRYSFDGTNPREYFCCGLFDQTNNQFVPQSLNWFQSTDQKFKYQTFRTSFTMRADPNNVYIPFYMNQNHNQWLDTEAGGQLRSSIKFKFYQFVTY